MGQMRIFVSHSSRDKDFCDALVQVLRTADADVWYDQTDLGVGELHDALMHEVHSRPVFIVVLSPAALASPNVRKECKWATLLYERDHTRKMVPVVAAAVDLLAVPDWLFLAGFKRVEGPDDRPYKPSIAVEQTLRLIGLASTSATTSLPDAHLEIGFDGFEPEPPDEDDMSTLVDTRSIIGLESFEPGIQEGSRLIKEKNYAEAVAVFARATNEHPKSVVAWLGLGKGLCCKERWASASHAFTRALKLADHIAVVYCAIGDAYYASKEYSCASSYYCDAEKKLETGRDDALLSRVYRGKAAASRALGDQKEALGYEARADDIERRLNQFNAVHTDADDVPF